jgi:hypothetical protein
VLVNPHIIILSIGLAGAMIIGAYWAGRIWYESSKAEWEKSKKIIDGLQKPMWETKEK